MITIGGSILNFDFNFLCALDIHLNRPNLDRYIADEDFFFDRGYISKFFNLRFLDDKYILLIHCPQCPPLDTMI